MEIKRVDVINYVYTAGVLASGVFLHRTLGNLGDGGLLVVIALVTIGWTTYYNLAIKPRIRRLEGSGKSRATDDSTS
jgi:hypothetical protein